MIILFPWHFGQAMESILPAQVPHRLESQGQGYGSPEKPLAIKTAIRTKDMAMRVKPKTIPKHLNCDARRPPLKPLQSSLFPPVLVSTF